MKKRFLSLLCAVTLVVSTMASFVVAHAEVTPPTATFKLNLESAGTLNDSYDEDYAYEDLHDSAPLYKITCTLEGPSPKTLTEDGKAYIGATMQSFQAKFKLTCDNENIVLAKKVGATSSVTLAPTLGENVANFGLAQALANDATDSFISDTTVLGTWYVFSADGGAITNARLEPVSAVPNAADHAVTWGQIWDGTKKGVAAKNLNDTTHITYVNYPAAPTTYTVTCDTVTNGTLSVDKTTAAAGDEVTITATPADNYKLDTLKVEDADGAAVTVTDNKFTMPAKNVTVKATFVEDAPVQSDFEKLGSYTADNSEKDKAVAFVQKLTDMVSSKTYQLYAMVGDKKYNYSKTITLPNITEGAISLGVVIQYNPDEVTADGFNPENVTAFGVTEVE